MMQCVKNQPNQSSLKITNIEYLYAIYENQAFKKFTLTRLDTSIKCYAV